MGNQINITREINYKRLTSLGYGLGYTALGALAGYCLGIIPSWMGSYVGLGQAISMGFELTGMALGGGLYIVNAKSKKVWPFERSRFKLPTRKPKEDKEDISETEVIEAVANIYDELYFMSKPKQVRQLMLDANRYFSKNIKDEIEEEEPESSQSLLGRFFNPSRPKRN